MLVGGVEGVVLKMGGNGLGGVGKEERGVGDRAVIRKASHD